MQCSWPAPWCQSARAAPGPAGTDGCVLLLLCIVMPWTAMCWQAVTHHMQSHTTCSHTPHAVTHHMQSHTILLACCASYTHDVPATHTMCQLRTRRASYTHDVPATHTTCQLHTRRASYTHNVPATLLPCTPCGTPGTSQSGMLAPPQPSITGHRPSRAPHPLTPPRPRCHHRQVPVAHHCRVCQGGHGRAGPVWQRAE